MSFYQLMASKYANRRTFSAETEGAAGGGAAASDEASGADGDGDDASADTDAGNANDARQSGAGDDGKQKDSLKTDAGKTDDEKARLIREVMEKKSDLKALKDKLKQFEGVDPEKYRKLVEKEQAAELAAAEEKGEFERVKQMMADAHKTEKTVLQTENDQLRAELKSKDDLISELTIGNAFGTSSFISTNMILTPAKVRVLYGDHFEVEDGRVVAYDKPRGAAERTKLVDASGATLAFDVALEKIVAADPDKNSVLRSKAKPGAGSNTDTVEKKPETHEVRGVQAIQIGLSKFKVQN